MTFEKPHLYDKLIVSPIIKCHVFEVIEGKLRLMEKECKHKPEALAHILWMQRNIGVLKP